LNIHSLSQLLGKIGEVEGKEWLEHNDYIVFSFQEILWVTYDLENIVDKLKRRRKPKYIEQNKSRIKSLEEFLISIFGEKFGDMRKFCKEFWLLTKEAGRTKQEKNFTRRGIGPDFIVKRNGDIAFVEVKVNEAELTKYQRACFKILKKYGFKTFVLKIAIVLDIRKEINLEEIA
jgi:hypothetical protein